MDIWWHWDFGLGEYGGCAGIVATFLASGDPRMDIKHLVMAMECPGLMSTRTTEKSDSAPNVTVSGRASRLMQAIKLLDAGSPEKNFQKK